MWRDSRPATGRLHVAAMHALAPQRARALLDAVQADVEPATALIGPFSPVMLVHTGPDLIGLAWWWEVPGA
jgi:fatty acid-binding protein DegV